jgi:hypothetical protein
MKVEKETHTLIGSDLTNFIFAGNATFTVLNETTKNRFTFRIRKAGYGTPTFNEKNGIFYISVLTGTDNISSYSFLGTYFGGTSQIYRHSHKSKIGSEAISNKVMEWFFGSYLKNPTTFPTIKIFHSGKCGRCGKKLTTPDSIKSGLGPYCITKS